MIEEFYVSFEGQQVKVILQPGPDLDYEIFTGNDLLDQLIIENYEIEIDDLVCEWINAQKKEYEELIAEQRRAFKE